MSPCVKTLFLNHKLWLNAYTQKNVWLSSQRPPIKIIINVARKYFIKYKNPFNTQSYIPVIVDRLQRPLSRINTCDVEDPEPDKGLNQQAVPC